MEFWTRVIARVVSAILSVLDSTNLRNQLYEIKDEHEIMWTALDDIQRMYKNEPAGRYAQRVLTQIPNRYTS